MLPLDQQRGDPVKIEYKILSTCLFVMYYGVHAFHLSCIWQDINIRWKRFIGVVFP